LPATGNRVKASFEMRHRMVGRRPGRVSHTLTATGLKWATGTPAGTIRNKL
jgi:hypothetical protein